MGTTISAIPSAKALINGLRSIGYSFESAAADIIDNSITAKAKNIRIYSDPIADEPYFLILDDGEGMNYKELENAMQFGSNRDGKIDSIEDLGRFGLGLKSASLSQCKHLEVISLKFGKLHGMSYDIDQIEATNSWDLNILDDSEIEQVPFLNELKAQKQGTIVLWKKFDKMEAESGNKFSETFYNIIASTTKHIEYVFHRFYDRINIYVNSKNKINRKDPFLTNSPRHQSGRTIEIQIDDSIIKVTPHTLPYANTITPEEKALLGNPKSIYDEQGFYIYRNERLIFWGTWMHMGYKSELNKLARVQIDIPSTLDKMWMLDVKKSSAKIPDVIKERIRIALQDSIVKSKRATRYTGQLEEKEDCPIWFRTKLRDGSVKYEINRDNPVLTTLQENLGNHELELFNELLSQIECFIPKGRIQNDNIDAVNIVNGGDDLEETQLIDSVNKVLDLLDPEQRPDMLRKMLGYENNKKIADKYDYIMQKRGE